MIKIIIIIFIFILILAVILVPWWFNQKTPQPSFVVIEKHGPIELRQYDTMLLATTRVSDDRSAAINTGFKRLAGYIFGRHESQDQVGIPMTAPVIQKKPSSQDTASIGMTAPVIQKKPSSQDTASIPMTAPVIQKKPSSQDTASIGMTAPVIQSPLSQSQSTGDEWEVIFVMPKKFTESTIPKPIDEYISLVSQPPQQYLTLRFTGLITRKKLDSKVSQLKRYAQQQQIVTTGEPILAFYDPPWIFPWLKRHEVWFMVGPSHRNKLLNTGSIN